jgi:hypothetical protein
MELNFVNLYRISEAKSRIFLDSSFPLQYTSLAQNQQGILGNEPSPKKEDKNVPGIL